MRARCYDEGEGQISLLPSYHRTLLAAPTFKHKDTGTWAVCKEEARLTPDAHAEPRFPFRRAMTASSQSSLVIGQSRSLEELANA